MLDVENRMETRVRVADEEGRQRHENRTTGRFESNSNLLARPRVFTICAIQLHRRYDRLRQPIFKFEA